MSGVNVSKVSGVLDGGDVFTVTVAVSHDSSSTSEAFQPTVSDSFLDTGSYDIIAVSVDDVAIPFSNGTSKVATMNSIPTGVTRVLKLTARVRSSVESGAVLRPNISVAFTSHPTRLSVAFNSSTYVEAPPLQTRRPVLSLGVDSDAATPDGIVTIGSLVKVRLVVTLPELVVPGITLSVNASDAAFVSGPFNSSAFATRGSPGALTGLVSASCCAGCSGGQLSDALVVSSSGDRKSVV